jgi:hypothetical protein
VLQKPVFSRDTALQSALKKRKTVRTIAEKRLSLQMLSNLLWSACGVLLSDEGNGQAELLFLFASSSRGYR